MEEYHTNLQSIESSLSSDNSCRDDTIAYIASAIENKIKEMRSPEWLKCTSVFEENEKLDSETILQKKYKPCKSTFQLCKITHPLLHSHLKKLKFSYHDLLSEIKMKIDVKSVFEKTQFDECPNHKTDFITLILKNYIRIQATYIAKQISLKEQERSISNKLRKQSHFRGR